MERTGPRNHAISPNKIYRPGMISVSRIFPESPDPEDVKKSYDESAGFRLRNSESKNEGTE